MEPPPAASASKGQSPAGPQGGKQKKHRDMDGKPIRAREVPFNRLGKPNPLPESPYLFSSPVGGTTAREWSRGSFAF